MQRSKSRPKPGPCTRQRGRCPSGQALRALLFALYPKKKKSGLGCSFSPLGITSPPLRCDGAGWDPNPSFLGVREDTGHSPRWRGPRFPSADLSSLFAGGSGALSQAQVSNPYPATSPASTGREIGQGQARAPPAGCAGRGALPGAALPASGLGKSREGSTAPGHPRQPRFQLVVDAQPSSVSLPAPGRGRGGRGRALASNILILKRWVIYLRGGRTRGGWTRPP